MVPDKARISAAMSSLIRHSPGNLVGRQRRDEIGDRPPGGRMTPIRRDLLQWQQHESPLGHAGMGQYRVLSRSGQGFAAMIQEIEIDDAWRIDDRSDPAKFRFDPVQER